MREVALEGLCRAAEGLRTTEVSGVVVCRMYSLGVRGIGLGGLWYVGCI